MATPLDVPPTPARRPAIFRRVVLATAGVVGILLSTVPAQAAPSTSAEAAQLVAARGHDLEVITEQYNAARETLIAQRAAAETAIATSNKATAALAAAQQQVRGIARTAYTGSGLNSFQALMTSDSADDFVDRMGTLQMVAGHQSGIVGAAAETSVAAARAQATAKAAVADAQASFDTLAKKQADLQAQVDEYRKEFQQLSAAEQQTALGSDGGRASRSADREPIAPSGPIVANSQAAQIAVDTALAQRGKPYIWAAAGPNSFDCSGLMAYAYAAAGINLPHSSGMQSTMGQSVSRDQLQPGDLIFFYSPVSHVGMYIGNGQMVHAPTSGDVVKIANVDDMGDYHSARRISG